MQQDEPCGLGGCLLRPVSASEKGIMKASSSGVKEDENAADGGAEFYGKLSAEPGSRGTMQANTCPGQSLAGGRDRGEPRSTLLCAGT